jgi:phage FluMu protein Com
MGEMLQFGCPCGYESGELFLGSGMLAAPERVAAHCRHCRSIVAVVTGQRLRCPKCRRKPEVLEPALTDDFRDGNVAPRTTRCPRCAKATLSVSSVGMWD